MIALVGFVHLVEQDQHDYNSNKNRRKNKLNIKVNLKKYYWFKCDKFDLVVVFPMKKTKHFIRYKKVKLLLSILEALKKRK